ncbi:MAG: hypothetical protein WKF84_25955 [Pyrinomonadaceae bacterium]
MKNNRYRTMPISLLLAAAIGLILVGCLENPPKPENTNLQITQQSQPVVSFINKVWKVNKSNDVALGQLYVFLSEGTLVIASSNGKPAFGFWTYKDGSLMMIEEGRPYKIDILKLSEGEFNIRVNNPGEATEIELVPATE